MNKNLPKLNIRHFSIRKKTASRICSTQVLYGASFLKSDLSESIKLFLDNYLSHILKELGIKDIDHDLLNSIIYGVSNNQLDIDKVISDNLSTDWSLDRLSLTEKTILRLATYELCFTNNQFKKNTIINEYISIMDVFGGNPNFANGILQNISK